MLWVRQEQTFVGGETLIGEYEIRPHYDGQSDLELIGRKEASARAHGWGVERDGHRLHTWQEYPANAGVQTEPDRVDRYFEIRE